jgi:ABC-type multidrug transport system ATPase subunit
VRTYSGGMRRRIDIAVSLIVPPKVLFLDEPTTGLDPRSRRDVWTLVSSLAQDVTVLLTTQYLEEADVLSDSIVIRDAGRVIASGTADALKRRTGARSLRCIPRIWCALRPSWAPMREPMPMPMPMLKARAPQDTRSSRTMMQSISTRCGKWPSLLGTKALS